MLWILRDNRLPKVPRLSNFNISPPYMYSSRYRELREILSSEWRIVIQWGVILQGFGKSADGRKEREIPICMALRKSDREDRERREKDIEIFPPPLSLSLSQP